MSYITDKIKTAICFLNSNEGSLKEKAIRSGFWVSASSVGINTLAFARSIILARLLMPEVFGLMCICSIAIRGIETFTQTGFSTALIHRQESFEEAKDTAFTLMVIRGFVLAVAMFFVAPLVAVYYEKPVLDLIIKIISITFILKGFKNINTVAFRKELDFKRLTYFEQASALTKFVVVVTLVYFMRNIWALVIGSVAGSLIETIISFIFIPGIPRFRFDKKIAKELFGYGKFIAGIGIVIFIASEIGNALIGKVLGMDALGYYVLAYTLANFPAALITYLSTKVMFPAYSKLQKDLKALRHGYLRVLKLIATLTIPAAAGIGILAPEIVVVVYGEKWLPSVQALQVLSFFGALKSIGALSSPVFNAMGKPRIPFFLNSAKLIFLVLIIYPLTLHFGIVGTSLAVTAPVAIQFIVSTHIFAREIGLTFLKVVELLTPIACRSIVMSIVVLYLKRHLSTCDAYHLLLLIILGIVTYALLHLNLIKAYDRNTLFPH